jgi:hypothetical protein
MAQNYEDEYNQALQPGDLGTSAPAPTPAAPAASTAPESWQAGYNTLLKQMGAVQGAADVYKQGSPLSADRHMQNIAKILAKDYGITSIGDIGVRYETRPAYETGSDESRTVIPEEQLPIYYNKKNPDQIISSYNKKFGSENEGEGFSEYNFQPVSDGRGGTIALPVQQYSKSGMGALAQDLGPVMSVVNLALMAENIPPLTVAAGNVAFQGAAGNIHNIGDVLKTAAPVLAGDPGILGGAAKVYSAYNAFDKGNVLSGLSSLASAVGMGGLANDLRFIAAIKDGNVPGALLSLSRSLGVFDIPLKDDLGNILKDADGRIQRLGNIKIGGEDNYVTLEEAAKGAAITANLLSDKPNYGLALQMAGDLAGSKDAITAGRALSLAQALTSNNPNVISNAVLSLAGQFNSKAPGSVPIDNRTANTAVAAVGTDLTANNVAGTQSPEQIAALELANANGFLASDLGTGAKLDTVNVAGTNPSFVNDDTLLAADLKPTTLTNQLTANQIAALTSGNIAALTSKPTNTLASVQVSGLSNMPVNNDTITDTDIKPTTGGTGLILTNNQIAALTSGNPTSLTTKDTGSLAAKALDSVQISGLSNMPVNDDTITDTDIKTTSSLTNLTSAQIAALTSKDLTALTSKPTNTLTTAIASLAPVTIRATSDIIGVNDDTLTSQIPAVTSGSTSLTSQQITALTSAQVPAATSGSTALTSTQIPAVTSGPPASSTSSPVLTSSQIGALTTTDPRGMMALPTSDARYWRQTGAQGTGGKGGVRFFDWYDTPENRTMAPPAMASVNIPAITSQQAEAMVNPAKRYFNQSTNRYYTDPTGQWTPPAGWAQTTFKDGGDVKTKHFNGGGMTEEEVNNYLMSLPSDNASYGNDLSGYNYNDADLGIGPVGGYGDSAGYDWAYGDESAREEDINSYLRGLPSENASYGGGKDLTGQYQKDIKDAAITGSPTKSLSNPLKSLADAAKANPNLTKALMAAGLGGLLGYMGRPKGFNPKGMQGGSLGLTQSQVHGALKGVPVKRAEGGEIDGYAGGGGLHYLKSAEDGMADKIPATIDNKQPAKLSGGEFVIPADVVSHLGNGNSEAGAKQLYAMMDRIRHARTGNKKQGKQINPAKFTPK